MSEDLKAVSYCVGMSLGGSLLQQNLQGISTAVLAEAIQDAFDGKEMNQSISASITHEKRLFRFHYLIILIRCINSYFLENGL